MSREEELIRSTAQAIASTVREVPPLQLEPAADELRPAPLIPRGERRWWSWAVPLGAAALVVVLAVTLVLVRDIPNGSGASSSPAASTGQAVGTANVPLANSTCSPTTVASASGGPASALTSSATEVASGTTGGQAWTLWSKKGEEGARGIEDGGLVIGGRAYGLCPGFPNPAELELADTGAHGLVYGVIGYPGLARVWLYKSTVGTFDTGPALPAPQVKVVDGVSFFIGTLPQSACAYRSLELNATSPGVSAEHNLGFGTCTTGKLVQITASQGIWQLRPGQFPQSP